MEIEKVLSKLNLIEDSLSVIGIYIINEFNKMSLREIEKCTGFGPSYGSGIRNGRKEMTAQQKIKAAKLIAAYRNKKKGGG